VLHVVAMTLGSAFGRLFALVLPRCMSTFERPRGYPQGNIPRFGGGEVGDRVNKGQTVQAGKQGRTIRYGRIMGWHVCESDAGSATEVGGEDRLQG
jgi:hypothetical protein